MYVSEKETVMHFYTDVFSTGGFGVKDMSGKICSTDSQSIPGWLRRNFSCNPLYRLRDPAGDQQNSVNVIVITTPYF